MGEGKRGAWAGGQEGRRPAERNGGRGRKEGRHTSSSRTSARDTRSRLLPPLPCFTLAASVSTKAKSTNISLSHVEYSAKPSVVDSQLA